MKIYLGVGSNLEPEKNIPQALEELASLGIQVESLSTHYRTEPLVHKENPSFINGIWVLQGYPGNAFDLKKILNHVESKCGRVRSDDPNSSRTLDILLMGDYFSPDLLKINFIYVPLLEMNPELILPGQGKLKDLIHPSNKENTSVENMHPLIEFTERIRRMIHE
jgi:2-amino-4-hydroxy-6-hydroxymethyldihydropteridine diphosphokinase